MNQWPCEWFSVSQNQSANFFVEDIKLREFVEKFYYRAGISKVVLRKTDNEGELLLFTAKPATILGKDGKKLEEFEAAVKKLTNKTYKVVTKEIKSPELSAKIMGEFAALQLESRMPYRRVAKGLLQKVMEKGALGVKVQIAGRLGGADISRNEKFTEGRIPLQTLRADIDYHYTTAITKYGILGIKVWICKGENVKISKKQTAMDKI
ncbi:MAG: 30S ribosomal protein S3 [Candidatus Peribacteria bacterium]|nr:MAG: 30S ribosomal protein S3 [Candidatus Peribacteria bacterium]